MSSADVASTTSSPMTLPTTALNTSEPSLQRLSTSTVTSTDTQLSFARSVSDSNSEVEVQPDNSFVIFSPTVSNLSTLTEPHSVSDLSLDFSDYGLSSLFGLDNTLCVSNHTSPLTSTPVLCDLICDLCTSTRWRRAWWLPFAVVAYFLGYCFYIFVYLDTRQLQK